MAAAYVFVSYDYILVREILFPIDGNTLDFTPCSFYCSNPPL